MGGGISSGINMILVIGVGVERSITKNLTNDFFAPMNQFY